MSPDGINSRLFYVFLIQSFQNSISTADHMIVCNKSGAMSITYINIPPMKNIFWQWGFINIIFEWNFGKQITNKFKINITFVYAYSLTEI